MGSQATSTGQGQFPSHVLESGRIPATPSIHHDWIPERCGHHPDQGVEAAEPQQQLIASSKTHRHIRATPTSKQVGKGPLDPWHETGKDPWAPNGPKQSASGAQDGKQRLAVLQEKLKQDLSMEMAQQLETHAHAAVQAAAAATSPTSSSNQDQRIAALEVGLKEIKGQNAQFNQWFQQAGERLQSTENTLTAMQQTINTHQHEIHTLGSTFQSTMKNVKDDLSAEMNESFNHQLSRLEALLEKKPRQA